MSDIFSVVSAYKVPMPPWLTGQGWKTTANPGVSKRNSSDVDSTKKTSPDTTKCDQNKAGAAKDRGKSSGSNNSDGCAKPKATAADPATKPKTSTSQKDKTSPAIKNGGIKDDPAPSVSTQNDQLRYGDTVGSADNDRKMAAPDKSGTSAVKCEITSTPSILNPKKTGISGKYNAQESTKQEIRVFNASSNSDIKEASTEVKGRNPCLSRSDF